MTKDNKKKWWKKNKNKDTLNSPTPQNIESENNGKISNNHESKSNQESCELNENEFTPGDE